MLVHGDKMQLIHKIWLLLVTIVATGGPKLKIGIATLLPDADLGRSGDTSNAVAGDRAV